MKKIYLLLSFLCFFDKGHCVVKDYKPPRAFVELDLINQMMGGKKVHPIFISKDKSNPNSLQQINISYEENDTLGDVLHFLREKKWVGDFFAIVQFNLDSHVISSPHTTEKFPQGYTVTPIKEYYEKNMSVKLSSLHNFGPDKSLVSYIVFIPTNQNQVTDEPRHFFANKSYKMMQAVPRPGN